MTDFADWQDITFDYVPVTKRVRRPDGEEELLHYALRDDVPSYVMVRAFGIAKLDAAYQAALGEDDTDLMAETAEKIDAEATKTLAGIFAYSYPDQSMAEWLSEVRRIFTEGERRQLVMRFFTRSRRSPTPSSASPKSGPKVAEAQAQGTARGKTTKTAARRERGS